MTDDIEPAAAAMPQPELPPINDDRLAQFMAVFEEELMACIKDRPKAYPLYRTTDDIVNGVATMEEALKGNYCGGGLAMRRTCSRLGLQYKNKVVQAWLRSKQ